VFVYREPVEVLVSHFQRPATWTFPGIVPVRGVARPERDAEYAASAIAAICSAALEALKHGSGIMIHYAELPEAFFSRLSKHFGCDWTAEEIEIMRPAASRDAKNPTEAFSPDSERKQGGADPLTREICEQRLREIYRRLESS
jgi:hypothetical protein